jgi:hypothetical protein
MLRLLIVALLYVALLGSVAALLVPEALQSTRASSTQSNLAKLQRQVQGLEREVAVMEQTADRYAHWRTCISWVPVNEVGDPDNRFGYLYGAKGAEPGYRPAIAVDGSEWDDPDYEFLAFVGRDRPFTDRECEGEPGESVD